MSLKIIATNEGRPYLSNIMPDAAYFLEKADQCFRLSRGAGLSGDIATELEAMAYEFMAKAVEVDTARDKQAAKTG